MQTHRLVSLPPLWQILTTWCIAAILVGAAGYRTVKQYQPPGPFDESRLGFCDFHNGTYYPTLAWIRGENPYSQSYADAYPVMRQIPLFSPLLFLTHAPLAILPLHIAEATYFALMMVCIFGCAWILCRALRNSVVPAELLANTRFRWWIIGWLTLIIVGSRASQTTLLSGYFSLELALITLLIFYCSSKSSWVASLALAYSSIKPTFAIPLGIILLAMGRFNVVVRGTTIAVLAVVIGVFWMAIHVDNQGTDADANAANRTAGKMMSIVDVMLNSQEVHRDQNWSKPAVSWTRIDFLALVAKWTRSEPDDLTHLGVMMIMLLPVCYLLWQVRCTADSQHLIGFATGLAILSVSVSLYKNAYDTIPLLAPALGSVLACSDVWKSVRTYTRRMLGILLVIPLLNYGSTRMFLSRMPESPFLVDVLTSINAVALTAAWLVMLFCLGRWIAANGASLARS